jgi:hypothetical protein
MFLIHGTYMWARKVVAYRSDYCLTCDAQRLAYQHRTFDVLHLFFVPILPLGLWRRWRCSVCGKNPHESVRTRRSPKWAGVVTLFLMSLSSWAVSTREKPEDAAFIWCMRIGGPLAFAWALRATLKSPPDVNLRERLRTVPPLMDSTCPVCQTMLWPTEPAWKCPKCGIQRRALPAP